jgi:N-methylhydantoinase B/oxoprolinase/acetone carboxylase alpha subunit
VCRVVVVNKRTKKVHLGAMQEAVKWQIAHVGDKWRDGDVIMSNHPAAGSLFVACAFVFFFLKD